MSDNYNATALASAEDDPVVVVTFNYRLNAFGFFFLNESDTSAMNLGIQDQRMALRWVQENIANFGGDPARVTLMGESAGSVSAFLHMVEKESRPLFNKVIAESGGPSVWQPSSVAVVTFQHYAQSLGCADLDCVKALPAHVLLPNYQMVQSPFVYVWDARIIPYHPQTMIARNMGRPQTDVFVGSNAVEPRFFSWLFMNYSLTPPTAAYYESVQASQMALYGDEAGAVAAKYYPFDPQNATSNFLNIAAPVIDLIVSCSAQLAAQDLQRRDDSSTYRYLWTVAPQNYFVCQLGLGATHTVEVPFFFGTGSVFGFHFTQAEAKFADLTSATIRHFAATGTAPWNTNETYVFDIDGSYASSNIVQDCDRWSAVLHG
jgi:para-nitrobenzyl esterase